ncbi:MAG: LytR/AlgR family response regulator transcription factor [Bacteroidota bacterium]
MTISCLIVEDEPLARNLMTEYVRKVPFLNLVKACANPIEALEILRSTPIDLLFLDVQMPEITGISFLKSLQKKPQVVLTTAYSEYALEGYELDVADYLLKPITFDRFLKAVDKVSQRLQPPTLPADAPYSFAEPVPDYIFVKDGTKLVKIRWADILYIEGLKDYVTIHTRQQKVISLQRLKVMEEQLPADKFMRIHNSFIVALDAIDVVMKDKVQIGAQFIPIGDTYRKNFKEFIDRKHLG